MELGLGIDVGSTFTDAVIVDLRDRRLMAWNKASTTHHDLAGGIVGSVGDLLREHRFDPGNVVLVSMCTTLATDSILESRGCGVGLIGIGWDTERAGSLGAERWAFVRGGHDSKGQELAALDVPALREAVSSMAGEVGAFAVSSVFSASRPEHEEMARQVVHEMTGMPVVAANELGGDMGVEERSAAAVLNARLLPIMDELLDSADESMRELRIGGRLFVLRGDGSLMPAGEARVRPAVTLLSGPAASLLGGTRLAGLDNCLVVDMGGTSTDMACFDQGFPRLSREGAVVAGQRTRVRSIETTTVALGGDSEIISDMQGGMRIGPSRVMPLALAGQMAKDLPRRIMDRRRTDFLIASRGPRGLAEGPARVYRKVEELGLCDSEEVREALPDMYLVKRTVADLVRSGHLLRTGLTPTDIFNLEGLHSVGDLQSSRAGAEHFLEGTVMTLESCCGRVMHRLVGRLAEEIARKLITDEAGDLPADSAVDGLVRMLVRDRSAGPLRLGLRLDRPLVGLGGPAKVLMSSLRDMLGTEVVVPEGSQVGNAMGAVCSRISETMTLRVQPMSDGYFQFVTPFGDTREYHSVDEAIAQARELAGLHVQRRAEHSGARDVVLRTDLREVLLKDREGMERVDWIEVTARATGEPR
ncbi:MAG: hydantoinase/oxoprolinase family protein [Euryarchaeota archaeon]|nr:hydantoinase/oxoprolinase family protein [Euryarchaeota archaeon]